MTGAEQLEIELDKRVSRIDAEARDSGHVPATWDHRTDDGELVASTRCTGCGVDACVRVGANRQWQAGKLIWKTCTAAPQSGRREGEENAVS